MRDTVYTEIKVGLIIQASAYGLCLPILILVWMKELELDSVSAFPLTFPWMIFVAGSILTLCGVIRVSRSNPTDDGGDVKQEFWQRQFLTPVTRRQTIFDLTFGLLLPVLCFVLDPGFFLFNARGGLILAYGGLQAISLMAYFISALAMITLAVWLFAGAHGKAWGIVFGGVFLTVSLCCFLLGFFLFPFGLWGLPMHIVALGCTPFFAAFVFLRNGIRAMKQADVQPTKRTLAGALLLGVVLVIVIPAVPQWKANEMVSQSVSELTHPDEVVAEAAVQQLKRLKWVASLGPLFRAYYREEDPARKKKLAEAFEAVTGISIKHYDYG